MTEEPEKDLMSRPEPITVPPVEDNGAPSSGVKKMPAVTVSTPPMESRPTDSHALALEDHEEKGAAQEIHNEPEVKDLGWDEKPEHVPQPLVGGLPNEELWVLVRRFNQQLYHVKETEELPPGGLDLYIAEEDEFSPDKLRSTIERFYMTVFIGLAGFVKHIARLRSWNERTRTTWFCCAYFAAWALDLLMPTLLLTIIVLIIYPPSRDFLFPPAPLALISGATGDIQKPKAGMLGSDNSITGAPEKHKGEAVEQEASNFVSSFAQITLSAAAGQHPQNDLQDKEGVIDTSVPDPTQVATGAVEAKKSAGSHASVEHDKTKQPMEEAMWTKLRPTMHIIGSVADTWERFGNALSPTSPFPKLLPRIRLAGVLVPVFLASIFLSPYMFIKGTSFITGFAFFSQPLMDKGLNWLNKTIPDWPKYLDPRNSILWGVPTNAQLTITLLRIGEANKAPLPPPPRPDGPPPSRPTTPPNAEDLPMDKSQAEVDAAVHPEEKPEEPKEPEEQQTPKDKEKKHTGRKILKFLKGTTKASVETVLGTDHIKADLLGSEHSKNRLGILPREHPITGPIDFPCRFKGKKGTVYITTTATVPCVAFTTSTPDKDPNPVFTVPISDIKEMRKIGGLGWKAKLVVGWAMDRKIADGLEIIDRHGNSWTLTAIYLRDELFNRLVAMGGQKWESW